MIKHKELTTEEWNIFKILVENPTKTNMQIADSLSRSQHTIAAHVRNILSKLEIGSRYEMLTYALKNELYTFRVENGKTTHEWRI